ncbi:unnamed protein product, partial [Urochloa humidicola]
TTRHPSPSPQRDAPPLHSAPLRHTPLSQATGGLSSTSVPLPPPLAPEPHAERRREAAGAAVGVARVDGDSGCGSGASAVGFGDSVRDPTGSGVSARGQAGSSGAAAVASNEE